MNIYEVFEKYANDYDAWYDSQKGKILYENEKKCVSKLIDECHGRILEIGVGTGRFAVLTSEAFGVDIARSPLKLARSRGIKVIQARAEELPFKDKSFFCVMLIVTLCFVNDALIVLKEAKRVLKDEGKIIIGTVFLDSEWGKFYEQKKKKGHHIYKFANFYTFEDFKKMVDLAGLNIKKIFGTLKKSPFDEQNVEKPELIIDDKNIFHGFICLELTKQ